MKIAIFHELPRGGARIATNEIAENLKRNHQVDLFYVDETKEKNENIFYNKIYFYKFIPKKWEGRNWKVRLYKDTIELYKLFKLHKKIADDIRNKKYNVLLVNASRFLESPFILQFPNVKKIFYLHDPHDRSLYESNLILENELDIFRKTYQKMNRLIRIMLDKNNLSGADMFLANSHYTQRKFKKTYGKESIVSYLGVDTEFFNPTKEEKFFDILYVGSHQPVDGYHILKNALNLIKKKLKERIIFFEDEWLSRVELRKLYRKSKIVVVLGKNEPLGLVPLEAMACGIPVIAINEAGYKETIINKQTGYLIPRDDKILAKTIIHLLKNDKMREELGKSARQEIINNWSWKKRIKELEKYI